MAMSAIDELKLILREKDVPFFTDEELNYYLNKSGSVERAAYECLVIKSEDTSVSLSGLSVADSSKYFRRLAAKYRPNNSGVLKWIYNAGESMWMY